MITCETLHQHVNYFIQTSIERTMRLSASDDAGGADEVSALLPNGTRHSTKQMGGSVKRDLLSIGIAVVVLIQIGNSMQKSPLIQLYTDAIARQVDSSSKKPVLDDAVQKELVFVRSTQSVLETLPSM